MKLVIDASVSLKWFLVESEPDIERAEAMLAMLQGGDANALQPSHWFAEVLAVIARKYPERAESAVELLAEIPFEVQNGLETYRSASRLSVSLKHHLFDTLYHAVALENGATLVTADEAYFAKARHLGAIELLADFRMPMPPTQ